MKAFAFALLLAGISLAGAPAAPDEPKSDLDRFQGTWTVTAVEVNGQKVPPEQVGEIKTKFKDKSYTQTVGGADVETGMCSCRAIAGPLIRCRRKRSISPTHSAPMRCLQRCGADLRSASATAPPLP